MKSRLLVVMAFCSLAAFSPPSVYASKPLTSNEVVKIEVTAVTAISFDYVITAPVAVEYSAKVMDMASYDAVFLVADVPGTESAKARVSQTRAGYYPVLVSYYDTYKERWCLVERTKYRPRMGIDSRSC